MKAGNQTPGARLRIVLEPDIAIGPGRADLLQGIKDTGSIAAAGRRMGMSYKRAWGLVDVLNSMFEEPLVESSRGGAKRGGATLTAAGERYRTSVTHALDEVELATRRVMAPPDSAVVTVSVAPSFLTRWLVPRQTDV